jgi:2-amino-4-hydroxy-6-hydroxymethyldihydropteridine diphosphokinase
VLEALHTVYLGLGANINPEQNLKRAVEILRKSVSLEALSAVWETPAFGSHGPNFLNAAARIRTPLSSPLLKTLVLRRIEVQLGRIRTFNKNAARTIDLDVLVYDDRVVDPKIWTQVFVAVPLADLLPELEHPSNGKTLQQVAEEMRRQTEVVRVTREFWRG